MAKEMGLDRAPIEFWKLVFLVPPNVLVSVFVLSFVLVSVFVLVFVPALCLTSKELSVSVAERQECACNENVLKIFMRRLKQNVFRNYMMPN